jgi:penicillin-binding protein 1A
MGIDRTLEGLQRFGFDTGEMPLDLSLALGSHAMTPLKVASAYNIIANGGYRVEPYLLMTVVDRDGNIIYRATPDTVCENCDTANPQSVVESFSNTVDEVDLQLAELLNELTQESLPEGERESFELVKQALETLPEESNPIATRVIEKQTAYIIDSMLKDVILRGTGTKAKVLKRSDVAGKTGTTNGPRDAWFSGYSPHLTVSTWVGFDDNSLIGRNEYGGSAALPIWIDFVREALDGKADTNRPQPDGMLMVKIDAKTGKRVDPKQSGIFEFFKAENVPELTDGEALPSGEENSLPDDLF